MSLQLGNSTGYIYIYIIFHAYCLLGQSPMSDITYIALITSISDYCGNQPPHVLHKLSWEAVAVRVGGIWNLPGNHDWIVSFSTSIVPAQTPVTAPIVPYITNQAPLAYSRHLCCCSVCLNTAAILRLHNRPPMGGGFLLTNKVTLGLVGWAGLTFTGLHWGDGSVCMQAYVMSACWTASDRDVRLVIM